MIQIFLEKMDYQIYVNKDFNIVLSSSGLLTYLSNLQQLSKKITKINLSDNLRSTFWLRFI